MLDVKLDWAKIIGSIVPPPVRLFSSTVSSGERYPAAGFVGVTIATFLPIDLTSSASSSSITTLFSDGAMPGPILGAP